MINTKFYTSRSHSLSPNVKRRMSEQLTKNKHPTNALSACPPTRPTCPTRPTIAGAARTPTRLTCVTCPTRPTIAGAARTPTRLTCVTCPTRLTCPTRPTIAGAARTPTRLKPLSLPSPLKPPISFSLIINNLHIPVKK